MKCYKAKWILTSNDVLEDMAIVVDDGKIILNIRNAALFLILKLILKKNILKNSGMPLLLQDLLIC